MCRHDGICYSYYLHDMFITLLHYPVNDEIRAADKSNQISELCYRLIKGDQGYLSESVFWHLSSLHVI